MYRLAQATGLAAALVLGAGCADPADRGETGVPWTPSQGSGEDTEASGDESSASDPSADTADSNSDESTRGEATDDSADATAEDSGSDSAETTGDPPSNLDPPEGMSSGGAGGGAANGEVRTTDQGGVTYRIIAPGGGGALPFIIVYSGTEGGAQMTGNLQNLGPPLGWNGWVIAVLDGVDYFGNGQAGESVLDQVRADYDIDNDRTYLLSESAGTSAGLQLGLQLRQSYFAAFWANDVNNQAQPMFAASELGFAPYGNAGPGGDFPDANAIVAGMMSAGYQTPPPAPYDGVGSDQHGNIQQFQAAMGWFPGKVRAQ